ncbi:MAG TPA: type II toxin-antitoxin system VapC family toxin [Acidobacteriaceae bacterium]
MVIDSSAMIAILRLEDEAPKFAKAISSDPVRLISAATMVEIGILLIARSDSAYQEFEQLISDIEIEIVPVDEQQSRIALDAFRRYGKGRHPARLNYGDCFTYALAKLSGEPLLFKGNDFSQTDVLRA